MRCRDGAYEVAAGSSLQRFFFFQAEDGIRDVAVTGVQTCALPISSAVLGAGSSRTFCRVILPLSLPGVVTAAVLSFAHTLGEFGVVLMVGGNLAGVTRTVSIDIYDHVQSLEYSEANRMALVLLVISFAVLSFVYAVNRRVWIPWPAK